MLFNKQISQDKKMSSDFRALRVQTKSVQQVNCVLTVSSENCVIVCRLLPKIFVVCNCLYRLREPVCVHRPCCF